MDNVKVENIILEKKMDNYGNNKDDFVAPGEFTVTISLAEYRSLVSSNATRNEAIKKAEDDKYDRNQENKDLKRQIEELKAENYELKKRIENLIGYEESNDGE